MTIQIIKKVIFLITNVKLHNYNIVHRNLGYRGVPAYSIILVPWPAVMAGHPMGWANYHMVWVTSPHGIESYNRCLSY